MFISYGAITGSGAEGYWVDQRGSFQAAVAASPVWTLLGKKGLDTAEMPDLNVALIDGELAWRMHEGGHTTGQNIPTFVEWASRYLNGSPMQPEHSHPALGRAPADRPVPRAERKFQLAHRQLLEKAKAGRIDTYFVGDSITRHWGATDYPDFLAHWRRSFHGWNAANFGWAAIPLRTSCGGCATANSTG